MSKVRLKQLAQDGATNGQVATWNNALGIWEPAPAGVGGGVTVLPFEVVTRTQSADGGAVPAAGEFDIQVGVSATPSGVTRFRFHEWTTAFAQDQTVLVDMIGAGNYLKIVKDGEEGEWAYYVIEAHTEASFIRFLQVSFVLASTGFDFDQSSDYHWSIYYSGRSVTEVTQTTWSVSLPASTTTWMSHGLGGFAGAFESVGTGPTLDYANMGVLMGGDGVVSGWHFGGYVTSNSGTGVTIRPAIITKTAGTAITTTLTETYIHAVAQALPTSVVNQWDSYTQMNPTGTVTFALGDELILLLKNGVTSAHTLVLNGAIFHTHISLG